MSTSEATWLCASSLLCSPPAHNGGEAGLGCTGVMPLPGTTPTLLNLTRYNVGAAEGSQGFGTRVGTPNESGYLVSPLGPKGRDPRNADPRNPQEPEGLQKIMFLPACAVNKWRYVQRDGKTLVEFSRRLRLSFTCTFFTRGTQRLRLGAS